MTGGSVHTVRAHNSSTASENRIHSDDIARQYGFRGGLVPGVTVYAYMIHPAAERWGRDWIEHGGMSARFVAPFYEGETVTVTADILGNDRIGIKASNEAGELCASGEAWRRSDREVPDLSRYAVTSVPAPEDRPPATDELMATMPVLGELRSTFHADRAPEFLVGIGDSLPLYREVAHPGYLIQWANWILSANVRLGPWIHTASEADHFGAVTDGDVVSVRGRVTHAYVRKGHHFCELDVVMAVGDQPAMAVHHTAIYQLRSP